MSAFLHASRRRERQTRHAVTLIAAVVATRWICADLAVAWPIQAASVVGFAVLVAAGSAAALIARRRAS